MSSKNDAIEDFKLGGVKNSYGVLKGYKAVRSAA